MVCMIERERERRQNNDNGYHTLVYSKYSICLLLFTKKFISIFKSLLFSLTKNTKNNHSQKMLRLFLCYKIFSNSMFIHRSSTS